MSPDASVPCHSTGRACLCVHGSLLEEQIQQTNKLVKALTTQNTELKDRVHQLEARFAKQGDILGKGSSSTSKPAEAGGGSSDRCAGALFCLIWPCLFIYFSSSFLFWLCVRAHGMRGVV